MPHPQNNTLRLLFWEMTTQCNLSCAHCRRLVSEAPVETDLSTPQAIQLFEQIVELGQLQQFVPYLIFSGGEPLCRGDLVELIERAAAMKIKCAVATNGTLIDAAMAQKLNAASVDRVAVSLDGATAGVHNKLRKQDGCFEAALSGIRSLRQSGLPVQINVTVTRHNADELDAVFDLARQVGAVAVHLFMLVPVGCGQTFDRECQLSPLEYERLLTRIAQKHRTLEVELRVTCGPHYERVIRQQDASRPFSKGCLAGSGVLFVSHDGRVFPCGYLPIDCGHVLQTPLHKIWAESQTLACLRDAAQLKGKCGVCDYRQFCGGCRARAWAATGDYLQAEPTCVYLPAKGQP